MRLRLRISMLCVLALLLATPVGAADHGFPFDHALHLEQDLECDTCHDVASSTSGHDVLLPGMDTCGDCHDVDDDCGVCHLDEDDPVGYVEIETRVDRFSHAAHIERGMACSTCHGDDQAPMAVEGKSECRTCHLTAADYSDCTLCHSEGAELTPESHGTFWESWHGVEAGHDTDTCYDCHTQSTCQECHNGDDVRPTVHPLNYQFLHSIEARSAEVECSTCHLDTQFCADCHRANNILPINHSRADWAMIGGDGGQHAIEALFDLEGCIACHDDGSASPVCADCHGR